MISNDNLNTYMRTADLGGRQILNMNGSLTNYIMNGNPAIGDEFVNNPIHHTNKKNKQSTWKKVLAVALLVTSVVAGLTCIFKPSAFKKIGKYFTDLFNKFKNKFNPSVSSTGPKKPIVPTPDGDSVKLLPAPSVHEDSSVKLLPPPKGPESPKTSSPSTVLATAEEISPTGESAPDNSKIKSVLKALGLGAVASFLFNKMLKTDESNQQQVAQDYNNNPNYDSRVLSNSQMDMTNGNTPINNKVLNNSSTDVTQPITTEEPNINNNDVQKKNNNVTFKGNNLEFKNVTPSGTIIDYHSNKQNRNASTSYFTPHVVDTSYTVERTSKEEEQTQPVTQDDTILKSEDDKSSEVSTQEVVSKDDSNQDDKGSEVSTQEVVSKDDSNQDDKSSEFVTIEIDEEPEDYMTQAKRILAQNGFNKRKSLSDTRIIHTKPFIYMQDEVKFGDGSKLNQIIDDLSQDETKKDEVELLKQIKDISVKLKGNTITLSSGDTGIILSSLISGTIGPDRLLDILNIKELGIGQYKILYPSYTEVDKNKITPCTKNLINCNVKENGKIDFNYDDYDSVVLVE